VPARHESRERPGQVVRRRPANEGPATGPRLDDPEELERAQRLADGRARDLELLGQLSFGRELVAGPEVSLLKESLDLLDDALIEADSPDRLDDGQAPTSSKCFWSGGQTRFARAYGGPCQPSTLLRTSS
jgi:hypothetical protein